MTYILFSEVVIHTLSFLTCFPLVNMSWFVNIRFSGNTLSPIDNSRLTSPLLYAGLQTGTSFQRWFGWKQKQRRSSVRVASTKIGIPTSWLTTTGDALLIHQINQCNDRNPPNSSQICNPVRICRNYLHFFQCNVNACKFYATQLQFQGWSRSR